MRKFGKELLQQMLQVERECAAEVKNPEYRRVHEFYAELLEEQIEREDAYLTLLVLDHPSEKCHCGCGRPALAGAVALMRDENGSPEQLMEFAAVGQFSLIYKAEQACLQAGMSKAEFAGRMSAMIDMAGASMRKPHDPEQAATTPTPTSLN